MMQPESALYGIFTEQIRELERWAYEDAEAAEREWVERTGQEGPGTRRAGVSPVHQWFCWTKELPRLQAHYETTGDFKIIFEAVTECINSRLPLPPWCAIPLRRAWGKIENFEHRSWDEVFGVPHAGVSLDIARSQRSKKALAVFEAMDRIDSGEGVVEVLKEVAKDYCVSYELACKWYYAHKKHRPPID